MAIFARGVITPWMILALRVIGIPTSALPRSSDFAPRARLAPWRRRLCDAVFSCGSDLTWAGLPQSNPDNLIRPVAPLS